MARHLSQCFSYDVTPVKACFVGFVLDFTLAFETFVNTLQEMSMTAVRQGVLDIGVLDNEILVFSKLMDAKSLFLTANVDTIHFLGLMDLTEGI